MTTAILIPFVLLGAAADEPAAFREALAEAVHHFAEAGRVAHLQAVLDREPNLLEAARPRQLGKPTHGDGYTPLQTAARHGRTEAVALLLKRGADVQAAGGHGYTALHLAAEGGHLDAVKLLVKAGAPVAARTTAFPAGIVPGGPPDAPPMRTPPIPARTALEIAESLNRAEVVAFLKGAR